jgi:hypothetical protein
LINGDFEAGLSDWTTTEVPIGCCNGEILRAPFTFANHTPGGSRGVWTSAFYGAHPIFEDVPVTGLMSQTVSAVAGGSYTFSGWARFEQNYSGGVDAIDPNSPGLFFGLPSPTETVIALEFLDPNGVVLNPIIDFDPNGVAIVDPNSPILIDLRAERQILCGGNANDETCGSAGSLGILGWTQHTMTGIIAPPGTASARLSAGMINGVFNVDPRQTAFFDDFSLTFVPEPTSGVLSLITLALAALCRQFRPTIHPAH